MSGQYVRVGKVSIEEFMSKAVKKKKAEFLGIEVRTSSPRLNLFKKSVECSHCKLKASFFAIEHHSHNPESFHLNLYGVDKKGKEILFTRDHTIPLSKGGKNVVKNTTTMCGPCNWTKGNKHAPNVNKTFASGEDNTKYDPIKISDMGVLFTHVKNLSNNRICVSPSRKVVEIRFSRIEDEQLLRETYDVIKKSIKEEFSTSYDGLITIFGDRSVRAKFKRTNGKHHSYTVWHNQPKKSLYKIVSEKVKNIFKNLFTSSSISV